MLNVVVLLVGFILLIYGASKLVDSSSALAGRLGIPNIVIGLTIVAFGTSAPELLVSVFASISHNSDLAIGNVVGSNIFNILFIVGVSALMRPLVVKSGTTWIEIPMALLAALVLVVMANDGFLDKQGESFISRSDGIILIFFFIIFLVYNMTVMKSGITNNVPSVYNMPIYKSVLWIIAGLIMLVAGARAIVYSSVNLAVIAGISERVIGLTIVSIGTSLPEAATSIVAARKNNADIAIGNIVGSNIFNIFLVLGMSSSIRPIAVNPESNIDLGVNILASLLLFLFIFTGRGRKIGRIEGAILLLIFISYMAYLLLS